MVVYVYADWGIGEPAMTKDNCAGCNCSLYNAREDGVSGIYNPGPKSFRLCVECWENEEAIQEALLYLPYPKRLRQ